MKIKKRKKYNFRAYVKELFPLGNIHYTDGIREALSVFTENEDELLDFVDKLITRHQSGDYGSVTRSTQRENDEMVGVRAGTILSEYSLPTHEKIWIITELSSATQPVTTVLLPEEY